MLIGSQAKPQNSNHPMRRCIITGASGYLGRAIASRFRDAGWDVVELLATTGDRWRLDAPLAPESFRDIEAVVHCAYDFRPLSWREIERVNVSGSLELFRAAAGGGVRKLVFMSSMAAYADCKSLYGKAKVEVESEVIRLGGLALRPGLVYSESFGGMIGKLAELMERTPVLPLVSGGRQIVYLAHSDDVAQACLDYVEGRLRADGQCLTAANPKSYTFREVLKLISSKRRKKVWFLNVPSWPIWVGLKLLESCGKPLRLRSDSLVSLMHTNPNPDFSAVRSGALHFRDLDVGETSTAK